MEIFKKPGLVDEALGKLGKPYSIYYLIMDSLDFKLNHVERRGEV